jgi:hypothetical protein
MLGKWLLMPALAALLIAGSVRAADYAVEPLNEGPPADALAPDIAAQLSTTGFKVLRGKRAVAEFWPAKKWTIRPDFAPSASVLYPLTTGSLVGAVRYGGKTTDFRNQDIKAGVYTLRYANQPEDGNHVGTFDTRDFLVMIPAAKDKTPDPIADEDLFAASAGSTESTHPAIMPLVKPEASGDLPSIRHLEEPDWWVARFGDGSGDGKVVLELIVAGAAAE